MATLNVKNLPDELYEQLRESARRDHRSIAQQVVHLLSERLERQRPASIMELAGLGKEAWSDVDATEHVRQERDSWD